MKRRIENAVAAVFVALFAGCAMPAASLRGGDVVEIAAVTSRAFVARPLKDGQRTKGGFGTAQGERGSMVAALDALGITASGGNLSLATSGANRTLIIGTGLTPSYIHIVAGDDGSDGNFDDYRTAIYMDEDFLDLTGEDGQTISFGTTNNITLTATTVSVQGSFDVGGTPVPGPQADLFNVHFDLATAVLPAANPPQRTARNEHTVLAFDSTASESAVFESHGTDYWNAGAQSFTVEVWVTSTATSGAFVFQAELEAIGDGTYLAPAHDIDADGFDSPVLSASTTINATSGVPTLCYITIPFADQDDLVGTTQPFRLRISRLPANAGDTMAADAQVLRVVLRQG